MGGEAMATNAAFPAILFVGCALALAGVLLVLSAVLNPKETASGKRMPYESGMDPVHDTRRRFDVRFHLMAIAFVVFDVDLLFLYPGAVATRAVPSGEAGQPEAASQAGAAAATAGLVGNRDLVFAGAIVFIALLTLGFLYDWRKGVFRWR
jgi:NADH-quinone oxidoreductase subunit A